MTKRYDECILFSDERLDEESVKLVCLNECETEKARIETVWGYERSTLQVRLYETYYLK